MGWEDALEEEMPTYSRILAWRIPMNRGSWEVTVHGVTKSQTQLSNTVQRSTCGSEGIESACNAGDLNKKT